MLVIVYKIAMIFAVAGLGLFLNKIGMLPNASTKYLFPLLVQVTAPCMILRAMVSAELTPELMDSSVAVLLGSVIFFAAALIVAYPLVTKTRLGRNHPKDSGVYLCLITMVNNGFMGMPIALVLYGERALYLMVLFNVVLTAWIFSAGFVQVHLGDPGATGLSVLKSHLKSMINPAMIASLAGLFLIFSGLKLPSFVLEFIDPVADMCVPLSMIVVGVQLGESDLKTLLTRGDLWYIAFLKLIFVPALTTAALLFIPIPDEAKLALAFGSAFPSGVMVTAIAAQEGKNATLASEGVAFTTALSMGTIPLAAFVMNELFV